MMLFLRFLDSTLFPKEKWPSCQKNLSEDSGGKRPCSIFKKMRRLGIPKKWLGMYHMSMVKHLPSTHEALCSIPNLYTDTHNTDTHMDISTLAV